MYRAILEMIEGSGKTAVAGEVERKVEGNWERDSEQSKGYISSSQR